jgi:hypothetical protein
MTHHALALEETGYRDARLHKPIASLNPHYLRGYRQGEGDRPTFHRFWETYQLLKTSEPILNRFRTDSEIHHPISETR